MDSILMPMVTNKAKCFHTEKIFLCPLHASESCKLVSNPNCTICINASVSLTLPFGVTFWGKSRMSSVICVYTIPTILLVLFLILITFLQPVFYKRGIQKVVTAI